MANTTIQLKFSTIAGNTPSTLANGELAINSFDGKIFYSNPSGVVQTIQRYTGPAGLNTELQFNDSGVLGASANLTFNKTTGTLTTNVANVKTIVVENISLIDAATITTSSTSAATLLSFPSTSYGSAKFLIQATQGTSRQITEILVVHNGTTADATEYGTILTGPALFSVEVNLASNTVFTNVTTTSATSTTYKTYYTLLTA